MYILGTIVDALPVQHATNSSRIHKGEGNDWLIIAANVARNVHSRLPRTVIVYLNVDICIATLHRSH